MNPVLVIDSNDPLIRKGLLFQEDQAVQPGQTAFIRFANAAQKAGFDVVTADDLFRRRSAYAGRRLFLFSDMPTRYTPGLLSLENLRPVYLYSWESPNVARRFYQQLPVSSAHFLHTSVFRGAQKAVASCSQFHTVYWPNNNLTINPGMPWSERKRLVMIVRNKARYSAPKGARFPQLRRHLKRAHWWWLQHTNPLFNFDDYYQVRLSAIRYFAGSQGYDLYGEGWDQPVHGTTEGDWQAIQKAWRGPLAPTLTAKQELYGQYRFALCMENCAFPGYVTEKIFDCLLGDTIPVYAGAPDIGDFVPSETFIDFRQFEDFDQLNQFLTALPEQQIARMRDAARDFLNSEPAKRFTADSFAEHTVKLFQSAL